MSSDNNNNAQQQRPDTQGLDVLSALCGGVSKNGFDGTHQLPTTTGRRNPVLAQQNQQATGQNHQFGQMHGNHHIMPADATSFMNQGLYIGGGQHQHQLTHPQHQQQQISNVSSSAAAGVQQGDLLTHQALNIMLQQQLLASMKAGPIDHLGVHPGPGASSAPTPAPATNHQGVQGMVSHLHRLAPAGSLPHQQQKASPQANQQHSQPQQIQPRPSSHQLQQPRFPQQIQISPKTQAMDHQQRMNVNSHQPSGLALGNGSNYDMPPPPSRSNSMMTSAKRGEDEVEENNASEADEVNKKQQKRAANRKSAQLSRKRKKQFIEELRNENHELRKKELILRSIPDLIIVFDSAGKIHFLSHSVTKLLKFAPGELEGTSFWNRISENSVRLLKSAFMDALAARAAGSETAPLEGVSTLKLIDRNGSIITGMMNGVVHFAGDAPECVCSIRAVDVKAKSSDVAEIEAVTGSATVVSVGSSVTDTSASKKLRDTPHVTLG